MNEAASTDDSPQDGSFPVPSLAARVDQLFRTLRPPHAPHREYSYEEVAEELGRRGRSTVSATYLYMLRTGRRDNPTKRHLEALAAFFRVPPAYFFDDGASEQIYEELRVAAALRDADVRSVALRASGLSRTSLTAISDIITQARRIEGLPDDAPGPDDSGPGDVTPTA